MAKLEVAVSPLAAHLGYWMRLVSNHVSHAFKLKLEARGVTVAEWVVLRTLFDAEGVNPSQLAQGAGLTRGAVSKLIDRLVAKELVRCVVEKEDRRFQKVKLTGAGGRLVPRLAALADRNEEEFFGHLDEARRGALRATLQDVVVRRGLTGSPVD